MSIRPRIDTPAATELPERGPGAQGPVAGDPLAVEKLQVTLEELRVTEEELRAQNEELQAARERLETERLRYQVLFEWAPDPYLVTGPEGRIREANRAAAEVFNLQPHFLLGKPLAVFIPRDQRRDFRERFHRLLTGAGRDVWESPMLRRRAPPFQAALTVGVEHDAKGAVTALRWLVRDVTAQKQAERLAAIGEMVAGLAHESRNALQRSEGCLERLAWRLEGQPDALDLIARIRKAHDDLRRLFNDVRDYARPLRLEWEVCDLAEIWREAWGTLAVRRQGRDAELSEEPCDQDLHCVADPFRLQQVFWNILDNALAASPDPVRITVRCLEITVDGRPALVVAFRDNGPGLSAEQSQRIFDAFYTTKTKGMGLGMAIAKRIVEAHGGEIVAGQAEPRGAEIRITLPRRVS
jgi:PAS domain S-box-containing protein